MLITFSIIGILEKKNKKPVMNLSHNAKKNRHRSNISRFGNT